MSKPLTSDQVERLKAISARHDLIAPQLETAFEIVRVFLRNKQRIIYGGTAIDFALRLKGTQLYSDARNEAYPDYDFYSPDHLDDAYALAAELHAAGLPNVSAIRAMHFQTMKVRVDFVPVADISFMPADVYALLEDKLTLTYEGMRLVHPDFQRLDLHSALAYPFDNAPQESVFERLKKDVKRLNLLMELYPLTKKPLTGGASTKVNNSAISDKSDKSDKSDEFNESNESNESNENKTLLMTFGASAYAALIERHRVECRALKAEPLPVDLPTGGILQIASLYLQFPPKQYAATEFTESCRPFLDLIPSAKVNSHLQLFDISSRLPACIRGEKYLIPSAQLVLLWLLLQTLQGNGGAAEYHTLLRVIRHMEGVYAAAGKDDPNFLAQSPFLVCLQVHGSASLNPSQRRALDRKLGKSQDANFNWYPKSGKPPPRPSVKEMAEFRQDGECQ